MKPILLLLFLAFVSCDVLNRRQKRCIRLEIGRVEFITLYKKYLDLIKNGDKTPFEEYIKINYPKYETLINNCIERKRTLNTKGLARKKIEDALSQLSEDISEKVRKIIKNKEAKKAIEKEIEATNELNAKQVCLTYILNEIVCTEVVKIFASRINESKKKYI